ncbi:hypothetical protein FHT86_007157 [Rhizobium sp. BK313]|uniref:conjugal transfer protein TrbH n=1 Tax=Rhizobium sp. BK313 TaxID=2587081 RepID=UPI00105B2B8D|nr:conjugal transfer protein TrbH [Rhizobium sp. BK313]MBB3458831.1 hypothetical protein [Rhizobium sp. BK313]
MWKLVPAFLAVAFLSGCQTIDDDAFPASSQTTITSTTASAIAGDMASRLIEQLGGAARTTIVMNKPASDFALALEAALKGWGYTVIDDTGVAAKSEKPIELAYAIDDYDGQILARLTTPSLALGRIYTSTSEGAIPTSPLSITQRK